MLKAAVPSIWMAPMSLRNCRVIFMKMNDKLTPCLYHIQISGSYDQWIHWRLSTVSISHTQLRLVWSVDTPTTFCHFYITCIYIYTSPITSGTSDKSVTFPPFGYHTHSSGSYGQWLHWHLSTFLYHIHTSRRYGQSMHWQLSTVSISHTHLP